MATSSDPFLVSRDASLRAERGRRHALRSKTRVAANQSLRVPQPARGGIANVALTLVGARVLQMLVQSRRLDRLPRRRQPLGQEQAGTRRFDTLVSLGPRRLDEQIHRSGVADVCQSPEGGQAHVPVGIHHSLPQGPRRLRVAEGAQSVDDRQGLLANRFWQGGAELLWAAGLDGQQRLSSGVAEFFIGQQFADGRAYLVPAAD